MKQWLHKRKGGSSGWADSAAWDKDPFSIASKEPATSGASQVKDLSKRCIAFHSFGHVAMFLVSKTIYSYIRL